MQPLPHLEVTDLDLISHWVGFEPEWYKKSYSISSENRTDLIEHYLSIGMDLGYNPAPGFDHKFYLSVNDDVRAAKLNPLVHYLRYGKAEGRHPLPHSSDHAFVITIQAEREFSAMEQCIQAVTSGADCFISYPSNLSEKAITQLRQLNADSKHIPHPLGLTQSIFMYVHDKVDLSRYQFVCNVSASEIAVANNGDLKRKFTSKERMKTIVRQFRENKDVIIAGPNSLFRKASLHKSLDSVHNDAKRERLNASHPSSEWGFFLSESFWVRGDILPSVETVKNIESKNSMETPEYQTSYAIGLAAAIRAGKVILLRQDEKVPFLVQPILEQPKITANSSAVTTKSTDQDFSKPVKIPGLRGNLDLKPQNPTINGWLAVIGDNRPRAVIIECEDIRMTALASTLRRDLQQSGINEGKHSFTLTVPSQLMDGKTREFRLIDADSGAIVSKKSCAWVRPSRPYRNFQEYLKSSMTQPLVIRPFSEEDKRCFAVTENIANSLVKKARSSRRKPLVSVIMPVYNRANIVSHAIDSVLKQTYKNIELIIIDDGSTDSSVDEVKKHTDSRIKLIVLSKNAGHSFARNEGIRASKGDIIAYLDSDNQWDDRYAEALVGAYALLPKADAIATGQLLYRGSETEPYAVRYGHLNYALLENRNYIDLNAFSHRRAILKEVNGFDINLRRFVDYDLILRIADRGTIYSVPILLSYYYQDKAETTVTNGTAYPEDMAAVLENLDARIRSKLATLATKRLKKRVSVVIPNWQALDDIKECLDALKSYRSEDEKLDIVVVDNDSDNEVIKYLRHESKSGNIFLIENDHNVGFTRAVNQGIMATHKKSDVLILNNDAIMQPGSIYELQRAAYGLRDAGMTVPRQILPPGTKTLNVHGPYADDNRSSDANLSAHHNNISYVPLYHDGGPVELNYAPFFATYIRRDVLNEVGLLDAEYGRHYRSDRVYCDIVSAVTGKKLYYVPTAHAIHKLQKATDSLRDSHKQSDMFDLMFKRNQWSEDDRAKYGYKLAPWDTF